MTEQPGTAFRCRRDGADIDLTLDADGLAIGSDRVDWLDVDDVRYASHRLAFVLPTGGTIEVSHLGSRADECAALVRELRGARRRPALTQSALAPLAVFEARVASASPAEPPAVIDVLLFPHVLTVEPRGGAGTMVPLPLVREVRREGYAFTLALRGLPDVVIRGLGARTDEFAQRLDAARADLAAATSAAFAGYAPELAGLPAPDGWAVTAAETGAAWPVLRSTWLGLGRAEAAAALVSLGDADRLRLGLWTEGGTVHMPFLLAAAGSGESARAAVEAVDADDRATFVFATDDLDRLNAALVLTAFRREALSLPDAELGRWAVAVRTQPIVRWARSRLTARVVHDAGWATAVAAALRP